MANNKLAIIGGSGLYDVEEFKDRETLDLNTPWGKPSDLILKAKYNNKEIYFLPRHGKGHFISPSNINFRANIDALKQLGICLLYTSPSPRDGLLSRMPSSA